MTTHVQPTESVSEAVVHAVSTTEDCRPTALPPLYNAVNPEALNKIFTVTNNETPVRCGQITFQYSDSVVKIRTNGSPTVQASMRSEGSE
jgi:hypothetical protein